MKLVQMLLLLVSTSHILGLPEATQAYNHDFDSNADFTCEIYLARSIYNPNGLGLFLGKEIAKGEKVPGQEEGGDMYIPLLDAIVDEDAAPWHNLLEHFPNPLLSDDLLLSSRFAKYALLPGISSMAQCDDDRANTIVSKDGNEGDQENSFGVHRRSDSIAGSFSYRSTAAYFLARQELEVGQEIIVPCNPDQMESNGDDMTAPTYRRDLSDEKQTSDKIICVDTIHVQPSDVIPGRGTFAKLPFLKGDRISSSPVSLLPRSHLNIDGSNAQLLKNYVFGNENSSVMVLPYGLGFNTINRAPPEEANVKIVWSDSKLSDNTALHMTGSDAMLYEDGTLLMDLIAVREITPGDELLMDYGKDWSDTWRKHHDEWTSPPGSASYRSASLFLESHRSMHDDGVPRQKKDALQQLHLSDELDQQSLRDNIMMACYHPSHGSADERCLWPCTILELPGDETDAPYRARFDEVKDDEVLSYCKLAIDTNTDFWLPERDIRLVDKPYTSDQFLAQAFRHEIGLAAHSTPSKWLKVTGSPQGDFSIPENKTPGWIDPIRWANDGEVVSENAYLLGLPRETRDSLLRYATELGVVELSKKVTYQKQGLELGDEEEVSLQGMNWLLQATDGKYNSDMHW